VWLFAGVVTLDKIRVNELDGAEVFSSVVPVIAGSKNASEHSFNPQKSIPASTGI
jgi:hypothetical protein